MVSRDDASPCSGLCVSKKEKAVCVKESLKNINHVHLLWNTDIVVYFFTVQVQYISYGHNNKKPTSHALKPRRKSLLQSTFAETERLLCKGHPHYVLLLLIWEEQRPAIILPNPYCPQGLQEASSDLKSAHIYSQLIITS